VQYGVYVAYARRLEAIAELRRVEGLENGADIVVRDLAELRLV
jgi:hypothetical protein